jgi:hypothetical protein
MFHNWQKIVTDKGFKTEKEMFQALYKKHKSFEQMKKEEFKNIPLSTIKLRMKKNELTKKRKLLEDYAKKNNTTVKTLVKNALKKYGLTTKAAKHLHITAYTLDKYIKQFDLPARSYSKINNSVSGINNDIYMGWESPCKDCKHRYKDKDTFPECKK